MTGPAECEVISRTKWRAVRKLSTRKGREDAGAFLAEGLQAVAEALASDPSPVEMLLLDDPERHPQLITAAGSAGIATVRAHASDLGELSDTVTSQGVFAVCRQELGRLTDLTDTRLVVICSQIRDPGNAGTVIRSADAFGADAVVFTRGSVEVFNPKTVRASVGSIFHLPIVVGVHLEDAATWFRNHGSRILAADGSGESLTDVSARGALDDRVVWVMGNEAWGLPTDERPHVDQLVRVPMWGRAESLNLATAAAICLFETARSQRER